MKWLQQQEVKRRVKRQVRSDPQALYFNDPIWSNMWYMVSKVWASLPPGIRTAVLPRWVNFSQQTSILTTKLEKDTLPLSVRPLLQCCVAQTFL